MKSTRAQVVTTPMKLLSEVYAEVDSKGFLLRFNDNAAGLNAVDTFGSVNNNDASGPYFTSGIVAFSGTGNPLTTNPGYFTPNGTDHYFENTNAALMSAFDLKTLADSGDHIMIVCGLIGADPTSDEFLVDIGDQWGISIDSAGDGRLQLAIKTDGTNIDHLTANSGELNSAWHNVLIDIYKTDANTILSNKWVDGTAGEGWSTDITSIIIDDLVAVRGTHLFSDAFDAKKAGSFSGLAQCGYLGMFRVTSDIASQLNDIALAWHRANPGPSGEVPYIMSSY